jgi:hypothetical protein
MRALAFLLSIAITLDVARGDMPLPPPSKVTVTTPSGRIRAVSDPETNITHVEDAKSNKSLWSLPNWYRNFFVSDDGMNLVAEYNGLNLIPTDYQDDLVLLTFWREGKKIREITVRDFFADGSRPMRTASNYTWRGTLELDERGRLKAERSDGKIFFFDLATGKETKT